LRGANPFLDPPPVRVRDASAVPNFKPENDSEQAICARLRLRAQDKCANLQSMLLPFSRIATGARDLEFLSTLKGAITWLGASVAALTVLCYGAGYFALHAYLRMLGLDGMVPVKPAQMLVEGAEFWRWLLEDLFLCLAFVIVLGLVVYIIVQHIQPVRNAVTTGSRAIAERWNGLCSKFPRIESFCILVLFLAALEIHSYSFDAIDRIARDQCSILFTRAARPTYYWLLGDGSAGLAISYFALLVLVFIAFSPKLKRDISRTAVHIVRLAVGLYFAVYTLCLPPAFGVLTHKSVYPQVAVNGPGGGYLLYQDDNSLILWLPHHRQAVWLPARDVRLIQTVGPPLDILKTRGEILACPPILRAT